MILDTQVIKATSGNLRSSSKTWFFGSRKSKWSRPQGFP